MAASVRSLQAKSEPTSDVNPAALRALAEGQLALGNWRSGAQILADYSKYCPEDFDANFSRGVAFANSREGRATDVQALRAYNDAVVFMPASLENKIRARLFTYRGAMLKRMGRFEEALADFRIAEKFADSPRERDDLTDNVVSTYALMGERGKMMEIIESSAVNPAVRARIRERMGDYFVKYSSDADFLSKIGFEKRS